MTEARTAAQTTHTATRGTAAPRPAAPAGRAALPGSPPHFAGRAAELTRLREEVGRPAFGTRTAEEETAAAGRTRVLVVAGRPGSGRTSLALHFARGLAADYPDGQFFVRLGEPGAGAVPAGRVARELLAALGEPGGQRPVAERESGAESGADRDHPDCVALRAALAGRRALLVLDDVRTADQLAALLPQAPGCLMVAVTAGPLTGIADARPCVISGLDLRTALGVVISLAGDTRIVCDPVAARGLVELLACHPTALRLVGGWLRTRPGASVADARQLLAETPSRVSLLKQPGAALRDTDPLRRAFDLAYEGLSAPAARLLRLLTIAPEGRAEPRTASALLGCPVDTAAAHLAALAEQQLLNPGRPGDGHELPECLRAPLTGLLAADRAAETELARARMLERLVRLLTACVHRLAPGSGPEPEPLPAALRFGSAADAWRWLDRELPVLRGAVRIAVADGELDGLAMRLATTLVRALPLWAGSAEAVAADLYELHGTVLELAARGGRIRQQAAALVNLGDLHARAGEHARALERYRAALGPARSVDDQVAVARILEAVAGAYRASGDLVRAATGTAGRWLRRSPRARRGAAAAGPPRRAHAAQGARRGAARIPLGGGDAPQARRRGRGGGRGSRARAQELSGSTEQGLRTQREALAAAARCPTTRPGPGSRGCPGADGRGAGAGGRPVRGQGAARAGRRGSAGHPQRRAARAGSGGRGAGRGRFRGAGADRGDAARFTMNDGECEIYPLRAICRVVGSTSLRNCQPERKIWSDWKAGASLRLHYTRKCRNQCAAACRRIRRRVPHMCKGRV
ncbi:ATP-binding protein [Streptacidiphilus sp. 4-A2]|nr:ATP-binding protein [Streptacidiphilus sp. 4-A2]